jgi:DNA-binding transcriptional MerR regulator
MKRTQEPLWTIDQLGAKAAEALALDYDGPPNDRVRDVPDRRTIRYYTTLGLIDRAAEIRGRTAFYGPRHLMQLAAIKRLQARGLSLAEVQRRIVGLTDSGLAPLARLPAGLNLSTATGPETTAPRPRSEGSAFWKEAPAPLEREPAPEENRDDRATDTAPPLQGIRLGADATLLIAATRPVDEEDLEAIRKAAGPLLRLLTRRGLIGPGPGKEKGDR